jgi:RHS repeat-associated protein
VVKTVSWPAAAASTVDSSASAPTARTASPSSWVSVGGLPVSVSRPSAAAAPASASSPTRATVRVAGRDIARRARVAGVVLALSRADGQAGSGLARVAVDYSSFAAAFGGGFGSRLRPVSMPSCVLTTPDVAACQVQTPIAGWSNDEVAKVVSVDTGVAGDPAASGGSGAALMSSGPAVVALTAGASSSSGDFSHTSLAASLSWQAGGSSGEFTTGYPLRVPPSVGGPAPSLSVDYSSGSVDGRTWASNNQPSWVGEGWDLAPGFIERTYANCSDDGETIHDLCWQSRYQVSMVWGGHSTELVRDDAAPNTWRGAADSGLKVELLTGANNGDNDGEYWKVTAQDGTQYFFGRNYRYAGDPTPTNSTQLVPVWGNNSGEPCNSSSGLAWSWCQQAYRWNLDYIVDPRGNSMTYFWSKYGARYGARNNAAVVDYDITATLARIEYGTRAGSEGGSSAPARVNFGVAIRCAVAPCDGHPENWPDTPWDQYCAPSATTCLQATSPVFFTPWRLDTVTTQVWNPATSAYRDVEKWSLGYLFPDPGDSTPASLNLWYITHDGLVGGDYAPPLTQFIQTAMPNRLTGGGVPPMNKFRVTKVITSSNEVINVSYSAPECVSGQPLDPADNNTKRCYPIYVGGPEVWGWFNKYVVTQTVSHDSTGGAPDETWAYTYSTAGSSSAALWRYGAGEQVPLARSGWSWDQWRGYPAVTVTHGASGSPQDITKTLYYRGMDGDVFANGNTRSVTITDSQGIATTDVNALSGRAREQTTVDGTTPLAGNLSDYQVTTTGQRVRTGRPTLYSTRVDATKARTRTWLALSSTWRWTETDTTFDGYGLPVDVKDFGNTSIATDDVCTHTDYATRDTAKWFISYPSKTLLTDCATTLVDADYLGGGQLFYDGSTTNGATPTQGLVTKTTALASVASGTMTWKQAGRAGYDANGRTTSTWDALNRQTTTAYTPATGGPLTQTVTTNPAGHVTTTTLEPAWGAATTVVDPNNKRTDTAYDPLGRLTKVWAPGRDKATQTPNLQYNYTDNWSTPSAVASMKLTPTGSQLASYQLYDSRLRLRQTQSPPSADNGGRLITDATYDNRGLTTKASMFWNSSPPTATLVAFNDKDIKNQHRYTYDNLARPTADSLWSGDGTTSILKWQTTSVYDGDRATITPPTGGTATRTISDALGRTIELDQYLGSTPTGPLQATTYGYDRLGHQIRLTDPAGNQWTTVYDRRGRVTSKTDPDTGATTSTYDDAGQLLSTTDARSITLSYVYDNLGRQTQEWQGPVTTGTKLTDSTYDTLAKGQPTSSSRYTTGGTYNTAVTGYDNAYRPLSSKVTIPTTDGFTPNSWTTSQTYNVDGSIATTSLPAVGGLPAETINYSYDTSGAPTTMSSSLMTYVWRTFYYPWGDPYELDHGNAGTVQETLLREEDTQRLWQIWTTTGDPTNNTAWTTLFDRGWDHDPAGNVTDKWIREPDHTLYNECYRYDGLRQLTNAWTVLGDNVNDVCAANPAQANINGTDPYWHTYTYDTIGNRKTQVVHASSGNTTYTYAYPVAGQPRPHTVNSVTASGAITGTSSYSYDNTGDTATRNVMAKPGQTLTWDSEGHLASLTVSSATTSYIYDAAGGRLAAKDPAGETIYLGHTEIRRTSAGAVTATRFYNYAGRLTATRTSTGSLSWQSVDNHGTPELNIDANTLAPTRLRTDPFGNPRNTTVWPSSKGFVGGTTDPTGLTHLGAREYDPGIGRFVSADQIIDLTDPQQTNGYSYSGNNPPSKSDPSGLRTCSDPADCGDDPTNGNPNWGRGTTPGSSTPIPQRTKKGTGNTGHGNDKDDAKSSSDVVRIVHYANGITLTVQRDGSSYINGLLLPEDANLDALATKTADLMPGYAGRYQLLLALAGACDYDNYGCGYQWTEQLKASVMNDVALNNPDCDSTCLEMQLSLGAIAGAAGQGGEGPNGKVGGGGPSRVGPIKVSSTIGDDPILTKAAQQAGRNQRVQQEMDDLFSQLSQGNMNPGMGNKVVPGTDVHYARGRNGARLFFRNANGGIQVVGKADKGNESAVIRRLAEIYGR